MKHYINCNAFRKCFPVQIKPFTNVKSSRPSKNRAKKKMSLEIFLLPTVFLPITLTVTILCLIHFWQINTRSYKLALLIPGPNVITLKRFKIGKILIEKNHFSLYH